MKRSEFSNFDNFYNDVINNKNKNTDKKQFNAPTADGLNIRVPHDTVLHSEKEHTLTSNEWKDLLSNIDNIESAVKSHQRPRYSGIPVLLKVKTNNGCYGVVLEIFQKNNPIITTAFTDVESEIDNWIKVEAIPNGTETTFSDTRLNNIITHFAPNFKPKTYNETLYQSAISPKTSQKAKEVVNALKKIADGSEEETVEDLRNDLEQYGGTNDVTFVFGNDKKGIKHIAQKHGAKTLLKVFDTVVDGKVLRYVPNKKTVVLSKGDYEAVLSLDENGNKKTWLLSGWNTKEKSSGVSREVGTQSTSTQIKPTFSRQDLGAELNNSITNSDGDFNPKQSQKRTGYVFQEPAQPNLFVENAAQNHNKGFVGIDLKGNRGLTDINRNLILIGTTGDITTVLHESAHYFLNMLEELERVPDHSPKVDDVLFAIRKTLKNDGTPFTRSQHEKFAKGFEHYIYTGNARSNIFKEIYEDIKNLLKNIYEFVQKGQYFTTGEGALTEEEMKNFNNVFDEIFKLENKTVKERVFEKVLALNEKEEYGFFEKLTLFISLFFAIQTPLPQFLI